MAGVGELLVSAVVKVAAGKLAAAVEEQVSLWRNHKRDLNDMKSSLALVQAVLRDAEKKSFTDEAVREWLQQLKAVAYDISDTLADGDDSSSCSCLERFKAANKINQLKKKLTKVVERRTIFGFDLQIRPSDEEAILNKVVKERETVSYIDPKSTIVGRSEEREEIIGLLLKEEGTTILPIVGIGGMGKTTLAKSIFNDNKMKDFIGRKAWVYVSQKFDLTKIGKDVISELGGPNESCNTRQSVSKCLENMLKDGKFLIVLDDLWEEDVEQLHELKLMLQSGKSQLSMKIIVTTRAKAIAQEMRTHHTFDLKLLSDGNCWTVFKQSAFPSTAEEDAIGRDIAMKCKGLPLAAHTIGSLLRGKESIDFWKAIRDSATWNECDKKVLPSLRLSYDHMPYHLKQCFAYCAIFPKGFIITKDQLIQQWIALGFVQPSHSNLSYIAQAEQDVQELLEISFLQNSIFDFTFSMDIHEIATASKKLSMHDLVHDLAVWVSGDETLTFDATKKNKASNERHRHVLVANYDQGRLSKSLPVNLRALHFRDCSGTQLPENAFSMTKHVRVLDLSWCCRSLVKLSESVGKLKDLVHLNLSCCRSLVKLPESFHHLRNLEYLDLSYCALKQLPKSFDNLKKLRLLNLSSCDELRILPESLSGLVSLEELDLSDCSKLEELPESFGNLRKLRLLKLSGCYRLHTLPDSLSGLVSLEELDLSGCSKLEEILESFGNLKKLRLLKLSWCYMLRILPDSLSCLVSLEELDLSGCSKLEELPESFGNLRKLRILKLSWCHMLHILPASLNGLVSLEELDLSGCYILEELPESFANLKKLRLLKLSGCSKLRILPDSLSSLESLEELDLFFCYKLEKLPESFGNLKKLRLLKLCHCQEIHVLPDSLCDLESLEELDLHHCHNLEELPESFDNLKKLRLLKLSKCYRLRILPDSLSFLESSEEFDLSFCSKLE